jgi:hypothetical protein
MDDHNKINKLNDWLISNGFFKESQMLIDEFSELESIWEEDFAISEEEIENLISELSEENKDELISASDEAELQKLLAEVEVGKDDGKMSGGEVAAEVVHGLLDVAGFEPTLIGAIADFVNALIYLARGKRYEALLSILGMIPALGIGATIIKRIPLIAKLLRFLAKNGKKIDKSGDIAKTLIKLKVRLRKIDLDDTRKKVMQIRKNLDRALAIIKNGADFAEKYIGEDENVKLIVEKVSKENIDEIQDEIQDILNKVQITIKFIDKVVPD